MAGRRKGKRSGRGKGTVLASGRYTPWDITEILLMERGEPEWRRAWTKRMELAGDADFEALDPLTGEVWQYMDSARYEGKWAHCFRHRHHPVLQDRWYIRVPADPAWVRDCIGRGRVLRFREPRAG